MANDEKSGAKTTTPAGPIDDDLRYQDEEFNPSIEPKKSKAWINLLKESEEAFEDWNSRCDNVDKLYANLSQLSNMARDKQFQMFWANCEVMKPSIYAKPPIPVVVPKFKDRRPVYQAASEVLERCATVAFDLAHIDDLMLLVRDDVALHSRGVAWCRYEEKRPGNVDYDYEKVCIDYKDRKDFLHSISRNWREVRWVAAASYLTRSQARKRFYRHSGDAYQDAEYKVNKDAKEVGGADSRERAKFWEIWSKNDNRVIWVSEGVEVILDEDKPHMTFRDFFPCPKPAYGTVQPGSLVPVPDILQYKDQLDEVNLLTARIHALSDAVEAKGFYPAGASELSEAIQAAVATHTPGRLLVPISNWAAFGGSKEVIIWLPIDMIAQTITALVTLRKQIIDDIYQIMGLSDIMRGATDPTETLGAQQLKTQYGTTRIRDKQQQLVRFARDLVEITSEIITSEFDEVTMIEMSQTQLPTIEMVQEQAGQLIQQLKQQQQQLMMAVQSPQGQQLLQQNPQQAQQMVMQAHQGLMPLMQQIEKIQSQPTIDQVLTFLKDNKAKAFVLDIETDSTIQIDENTEKQRRSEFIGVLGQLLPQLASMITAEPKTADFCGELLKFATAPFRAGRSLDGAINELVEQMKAKADQPRGDDPTTAQNKTALQIEQMKIQAKQQGDAEDRKLKQQEIARKDENEKLKLKNDREIEIMKLRSDSQQDAAKAQQANLEAIHARESHQAHMVENDQKMQLNAQKADLAVQTAQQRSADMAARASERQAAQQFKQQQALNKPGPI